MWDKEKLINLNPKILLIRLNVNGPVNQLKDTGCLTGFLKMSLNSLGVTSGSDVPYISGAHFCDATSVCRILCSPPAWSPSVAIYEFLTFQLFYIQLHVLKRDSSYSQKGTVYNRKNDRNDHITKKIQF